MKVYIGYKDFRESGVELLLASVSLKAVEDACIQYIIAENTDINSVNFVEELAKGRESFLDRFLVSAWITSPQIEEVEVNDC